MLTWVILSLCVSLIYSYFEFFILNKKKVPLVFSFCLIILMFLFWWVLLVYMAVGQYKVYKRKMDKRKQQIDVDN